MKKSIKVLVALLIAFSTINPAFAVEKVVTIEKVSETLTRETVLEVIKSERSTYRVSGNKTTTMKNGNTVLWTVTVYGTFEYDGNHSTCTAASVSTTCPSSQWKITSKSATKSGSSAIARATGTRYNNGVAVESHTEAVTIVCGANGTLY